MAVAVAWRAAMLLVLAGLFVRAMAAASMSCCLSWRFAVEANNARAWPAVPPRCVRYVEDYMLGGQYKRDLDAVMEQILIYLNQTVAGSDGLDAWVLDIDDTCLSNLVYYRDKHYGGDPFDPLGFKSWAQKGVCPSIPAVLQLYKRLIEKRFKVFLITGRDEEVFSSSTSQNLHEQGFTGHERLIMRNPTYRGQGAAAFKSAIRKSLMAEGYRIRGNVGDQWSDLLGDYTGDRIFKIPNPMYFVP
ncbi:acid phosphatase 1-like [Canna indica]|uniref:Acid phosphatase 1-like n=1 Tax=Canna indica TaxID=4628 RepID=A0AAQ3JUC8_9LILI|nr:acid phosphatase 1-like [Canna indica]